jgi:hypothetical protein
MPLKCGALVMSTLLHFKSRCSTPAECTYTSARQIYRHTGQTCVHIVSEGQRCFVADTREERTYTSARQICIKTTAGQAAGGG